MADVESFAVRHDQTEGLERLMPKDIAKLFGYHDEGSENGVLTFQIIRQRATF